ncbi:MAG: hypothetical protein ACSLFA_21915, partial [Mycobacterium sp.]
STAFITIAVGLGESTVASLSGFQTLPVQIVELGTSDGPTSVAASLGTLIFGFALLLVLSLVTRSKMTRSTMTRSTMTRRRRRA